jgi:hypothetical protein
MNLDQASIIIRFADTLKRHPVWTFAITTVVLITTADAIREVGSGPGSINVYTWMAFGFTAYALVAFLWYLRQDNPARWFAVYLMAISPAIYGYVTALTGSPIWVLWSQVALSIVLVFTAAVFSQRETR